MKMKESIKLGNEDINVYYNFIQQHNSTGYTICPVMAKEGDNDEFSTFDLIQLKRNRNNKYELKKQFVELKGMRNLKIDDYNTVIVDLNKVKELQNYGLTNQMEVYIVFIWYQDKIITIHPIDLYKDYELTSEWFSNIKTQSAGIIKKGSKKMVHLPLYNVTKYYV